MRPASKIMYIEFKGHDAIVGNARIGRVTFSKSGKSIYYDGKRFKTLKGRGFKSNYIEVESGDYYWISGCHKDGRDALYSTIVEIDEDVRDEYWTEIRELPENTNISILSVKSKYSTSSAYQRLGESLMRTYFRIFALCILLNGCAFFSKPEPVYQGLTAAEWSARLSAEDKETVAQAAKQLKKVEEDLDDAVPVLLLLIKDEHAYTRCRATGVLINLGPKAAKAVPALREGLTDDFGWVRIRSALALSKIGPAAREAIPEIALLLNDELPGVRVAATQALSSFGADAKPYLPQLKKCLDDKEKQVSRAAAKAIKKLESVKE